ncbi:hypothetical protein [Corynebacterium bovis]|uniref:Uncharacterized protein n=2 Tax=Corynebacterium bovis TaxID=36808 RepID=A0A3R8QJJ9_9CORY|nr:hypothetical protein [Corynebacterium bovis]MBB3116792.1 hypothetical protein [Corynebacterium bovis DSM 20582 = CIP 54.80]QQC46741.1 hypothetical protein I6I09_06300 [Corynebacterium bovis]RRO79634.1 hypothetical protein CXF38_08800 [Corynebacterium bovis]RRO80774.1 hypothetical protein CXF36_08055 [Corynebacterium bovis]RRO82103.1 hypothetical protein CXF37_07080 [Corynebacterium bovis]
MTVRRILTATAATGVLAAAALQAPAASALPQRDLGPANPTTIGEKCVNPGDRGQTIDIKRTYFDGSAGTWTVSNFNDEPLPVTRAVTETKTKTWNVSASVDFKLLDLIHFTFSSSYTDTQTYEVGETVGPYNIAPGKTAVLKAGWVVSDFEGEKTVCGSDHTWQGTGQTFTASLPKERSVQVSTRDNKDMTG